MTDALFDDGTRWATLSPDGYYRYDLGRRWDTGPVMGFIMLNPSTADAELDDQTIGRCISFAKREKLAGIVVRNLYAFRTSSPAMMTRAAKLGRDVVGPDNDDWITDLAEDRFAVRTIVAAWGACNIGRPLDPGRRIMEVLKILAANRRDLHALRWPGRGGPAAPHPSRLHTDIPLVRYET